MKHRIVGSAHCCIRLLRAAAVDGLLRKPNCAITKDSMKPVSVSGKFPLHSFQTCRGEIRINVASFLFLITENLVNISKPHYKDWSHLTD